MVIALVLGASAGTVAYIVPLSSLDLGGEFQPLSLLVFGVVVLSAYEVLVLCPLWAALRQLSFARLVLFIFGWFAGAGFLMWLLPGTNDPVEVLVGLSVPFAAASLVFALLVPNELRAQQVVQGTTSPPSAGPRP
jgi:hypothetical protein